MNVYAIGDIHGCYTALTTLFSQIPDKPSDVFIFLGDYINRGPDSKKVLDWLIDFSKNSNSVFIQGNHEILMLTARLNEERKKEWVNFGGDETLKSYNIKPSHDWIGRVDEAHWDFIDNAKPYHQIDDFLFVHAGLEPGISLNNQNKHSLFWKKYEVPLKYSDSKKVICGHTSRKNGKVANFGHTVCIDTYAYGGQWLTGMNVLTGEYYQTNQRGKMRQGEIETDVNKR